MKIANIFPFFTSSMVRYYKRDFIIEKQLCNNTANICLSNFYETQIINPILNPIMKRGENPYTPYCFSRVESLLI